MTIIIKSPNADCPDSGPTENGDSQGEASYQIKNSEPKGPVQEKAERSPNRMADRSPFLILLITVQLDASMPDQSGGLDVVRFRKVSGDGLVIHVGQETIEPASINVVRIPGLFRNVMMDMVGDDINLLGNDLNDQISEDEEPETVLDGIGLVGGVTVQINRAMGSQDHHAVNKADDQKGPGKVVDEKENQEGTEGQGGDPAEQRKPVFSSLENIQTGEELPKYLSVGWDH